MDIAWIWIPVTILAAAFQVGRNVIQRRLVEELGTIGATQVRFLYGLPFATLLALGTLWITGADAPVMNMDFLIFIFCGSSTQIIATAFMLAAMRKGSFVVVTAYTKTEPIQVAIFGAIVLNETFSGISIIAIIIASLGVIILSTSRENKAIDKKIWSSILMGVISGGFFAVSAVSFRGALVSLGDDSLLVRTTWSLMCALCIQVALLGIWMSVFQRQLYLKCFKAWQASIWGGLLGVMASQMWFIAFALTFAANVRTLGLIEVLFAQLLTKHVFLKKTSHKEGIGILLMIAGVMILLLF
jgi:drug/metabolite transporter (DMT)-like permease